MDNIEHDDFLRDTFNEVYALKEIETCFKNPSLNNTERIRKIRGVLSEIEVQSEKSMSQKVREYVEGVVKGDFYSKEVHNFYGLKDSSEFKNVHTILSRLEDEGVITHDDRRSGKWRKVNSTLEKLDWKNASGQPIELNWPFEIDSFFRTFPKTILVIAGTPESGKTGFFLEFIKRNMKEWGERIHYFCSDMGEDEMKDRILEHQDTALDEWNFNSYERGGDFADCIQPNDINIFDFIEVHGDDFVKVGQWIKEMWHQLDKGIALIGLQKMPGATLGRGGLGTLEKARLYLTIEFDKDKQCGVMKVEKCKSKVRGTNYWGYINEFKLYDGWNFNAGVWHPEVNLKKGGYA